MKQIDPTISIVMPIYNAEPFIEETLQCLLQQTYSDFELICINDGSTDKTLRILQKYRKKFSGRMRIITQKNTGPGPARNLGISKARGEYLAILDADDVYAPQMLELAYNSAISCNSDLVVVRSDEYYPNTNTYITTPWTINSHLLPSSSSFAGTDIQKNIFEAFVGWPWDKLIRTSFVRQNKLQFQDLRSSEDALFCFMTIILAQRISIVDKILVHHRKVPNSVSTTREKSWSCFYDALLSIREQLLQHNLYQRFEQDFINYSLNFSLWHLVTLTGSAYFELYDKLKTTWWHELGIREQPKSYFYSPYHYELYQIVQQDSAEDFLFGYLQQKTKELEVCQQEKSNLQQENSHLYQELDLMRQQNHINQQTISDLYNSTTWKVGKVVTAPARVLKRKLSRKS